MAKTEDMDSIKLPEETKQQLAGLEAGLGKARKAIESMKKLGMDTKALEDKLTWAETVRDTLLKEFD